MLQDLDAEDKEEILDRLPQSERVALERSLDYPEDSAGRRMQTECIAVLDEWSALQVIEYLRDTPELPDRFYEIYVVDRERRLKGAVPLDALLVETDAPFLAPVPRRGQRNEPAYITGTAAKLAELRNMEATEIAGITTHNFQRLMRIAH